MAKNSSRQRAKDRRAQEKLKAQVQVLAGGRTVRGVIGIADENGMVSVAGDPVPYEALLKAVDDYAKLHGGEVESTGGQIIYTAPPEQEPDKTFERHPAFRRRLTVCGRSAFTTLGPEVPVSGSPGLVQRYCILLVWCQEQEPERRWYNRRWKIEHVVGAPEPLVRRLAAENEALNVAAAEAMIRELGLSLEEGPSADGAVTMGADGL